MNITTLLDDNMSNLDAYIFGEIDYDEYLANRERIDELVESIKRG